jgi:hypothetical protein
MLNQAPEGNEKQISAATAESAALTGISRGPSFPAPLVVKAGEDSHSELKRDISLLGESLRLAGGTAGFLMGGPAGAMVGSFFGKLAGEIAAERTSMIWAALGRAFLHAMRAGTIKIVLIVLGMSTAFPAASAHWVGHATGFGPQSRSQDVKAVK